MANLEDGEIVGDGEEGEIVDEVMGIADDEKDSLKSRLKTVTDELVAAKMRISHVEHENDMLKKNMKKAVKEVFPLAPTAIRGTRALRGGGGAVGVVDPKDFVDVHWDVGDPPALIISDATGYAVDFQQQMSQGTKVMAEYIVDKFRWPLSQGTKVALVNDGNPSLAKPRRCSYKKLANWLFTLRKQLPGVLERCGYPKDSVKVLIGPGEGEHQCQWILRYCLTHGRFPPTEGIHWQLPTLSSLNIIYDTPDTDNMIHGDAQFVDFGMWHGKTARLTRKKMLQRTKKQFDTRRSHAQTHGRFPPTEGIHWQLPALSSLNIIYDTPDTDNMIHGDAQFVDFGMWHGKTARLTRKKMLQRTKKQFDTRRIDVYRTISILLAVQGSKYLPRIQPRLSYKRIVKEVTRLAEQHSGLQLLLAAIDALWSDGKKPSGWNKTKFRSTKADYKRIAKHVYELPLKAPVYKTRHTFDGRVAGKVRPFSDDMHQQYAYENDNTWSDTYIANTTFSMGKPFSGSGWTDMDGLAMMLEDDDEDDDEYVEGSDESGDESGDESLHESGDESGDMDVDR
ncbi:unnamed protein product [Vitrella brassicaformis CCMP3155]|uniref:Uncharacterized protein n=1 Tax=Vitrella brassicaformis (strain CCMP3155) TaxID=1169540 RepID=A0A0G4GVS0_VITBC|nr:unnamed protein product [Vitrella brassicaformis CCMP3155]|eukprot:CEM35021.1 unnamed protein product [Vitrella brassicaformis CCMP3155]